MHSIDWPEGFAPGFTDNFASNETIVAGLTAADIWPLISHPNRWPDYYDNAEDISLHDGGSELSDGAKFSFKTFGFPVECQVTEFQPPEGTRPGRISWRGQSGEGDDLLDVHHAWLIEDLPGGRVRILTQETQNGQPAKDMAWKDPDPMINGHQSWLRGLVATARDAQQ